MKLSPRVEERAASGEVSEQQIDLFAEHRAGSPARPRYQVFGDDYAYLRLREAPQAHARPKRVCRVIDLFSGVGGMSLGVREACRDLGLGFQSVIALDSDLAALECYRANFNPALAINDPIESIFMLPIGAELSDREKVLASRAGPIDVLLGGPPCQGHSDLNNSTRRNDPRNALYLYMARAAEVFQPTHIVIENVTGAINDRNRVVQTTRHYLDQLGYKTSLGVVDLSQIGVPQSRKRLILVASRSAFVDVERLGQRYQTEQRDVAWAIADLENVDRSSILDQPSLPSDDNRMRIAYLFEHDLYDLPDAMRPACHRTKRHSYKSIYGRLRWDAPAQTITRGFYSMCMGRYVHPSRPRTLTAHEAARLQFFPDFFDFNGAKNRTTLARLIGNAVPMKLAYVITLELLGA